VSRGVRVGSTMEHGELLSVGILDGEAIRELDDPPRHREAAGRIP